jgi:hypothetical protein
VTWYYCDHDEGPCIVSQRAMERLRNDPARCMAHGAIIGGIVRGPGGQEPQDREEARTLLGIPFKKLYSRS